VTGNSAATNRLAGNATMYVRRRAQSESEYGHEVVDLCLRANHVRSDWRIDRRPVQFDRIRVLCLVLGISNAIERPKSRVRISLRYANGLWPLRFADCSKRIMAVARSPTVSLPANPADGRQ
jgi:hypothetical protein